MKTRAMVLSMTFAGAMLLVPATARVFAAGNSSDYSDRERMKSSADEKKQLEQSLKTGEDKEYYRRELERMGWQITSVNYDKPDYLEYEIVKGPSTYEVQADFDKNTHKSTKVDVTWNIWRADATKRALEGEKVASATRPASNANRFSDRIMMKETRNEKNKLEKALKMGEEKDWYRRELEKMGWKITSVNQDKPDYVEWEIVKGTHSYEVQLDMDKDAHKARKVDVAYNLWHADSTKQALKANETHAKR
jgi:hypothetical protein